MSKCIMFVLALVVSSCDISPLSFHDLPAIGEPCPCLDGVVTELRFGDDGSVAAYCAAEVGNPPLGQCPVRTTAEECTEYGASANGRRFCLSTEPVACVGPWCNSK